MAIEIQKKEKYLILHPRTGQEVEWTGDRILAYQITFRSKLEFSQPKKKAAKKKAEPKANPEAEKQDSEKQK